MGLRRLLEACQVLEKVALKLSATSIKCELEGSYDDLVHDYFFGKLALILILVLHIILASP